MHFFCIYLIFGNLFDKKSLSLYNFYKKSKIGGSNDKNYCRQSV